jgi:transcriptional regulator
MYLRAIHADATIPALQQLIRKNPLGVLTTCIPSLSHPKLQSSHIPFILDAPDDNESAAELGVLRGHLARANPQSKSMMDEVRSRFPSNDADATTTRAQFLEEEVLVLFTAAAQHYVTPKFYTETKPATGKVVPTWNYAAAQVYGRARIYYDATSEESGAFLSRQIRDLSRHAEVDLMGHDGVDGPGAWEVSDAPDRYIEVLQKNIIGIEIQIDRLEGKFKMSQEMGVGDREGVIRGFESLGTEVGTEMAKVVRERGEMRDSRKTGA